MYAPKRRALSVKCENGSITITSRLPAFDQVVTRIKSEVPAERQRQIFSDRKCGPGPWPLIATGFSLAWTAIPIWMMFKLPQAAVPSIIPVALIGGLFSILCAISSWSALTARIEISGSSILGFDWLGRRYLEAAFGDVVVGSFSVVYTSSGRLYKVETEAGDLDWNATFDSIDQLSELLMGMARANEHRSGADSIRVPHRYLLRREWQPLLGNLFAVLFIGSFSLWPQVRTGMAAIIFFGAAAAFGVAFVRTLLLLLNARVESAAEGFVFTSRLGAKRLIRQGEVLSVTIPSDTPWERNLIIDTTSGRFKVKPTISGFHSLVEELRAVARPLSVT